MLAGHSLGGALATLAAHEFQAELGSAEHPVDIQCYTFGAPRTGNSAWAKEFMQRVPECWHVINDQDTVSRIAKFWILYKRYAPRQQPRTDCLACADIDEVRVAAGPGNDVS